MLYYLASKNLTQFSTSPSLLSSSLADSFYFFYVCASQAFTCDTMTCLQMVEDFYSFIFRNSIELGGIFEIVESTPLQFIFLQSTSLFTCITCNPSFHFLPYCCLRMSRIHSTVTDYPV